MARFFKGKIAQASLLLALFSFIAKITGLLRDRILAAGFGASPELDVYYSAFKLPDLIMNLVIFGAVSSAFIPVFLEHYQRNSADAWRVAQNFVTTAFCAVLIAVVIGFIFAQPIASLIAPGFSGEQLELLTKLLRLMLISPLIFSVSTIFGSILQALERFLAYAIAPILYNLGIIIGAVWIVPQMRSLGYEDIYGLGLGVLLGALLHLAVQTPFAYRAGFRFRFIIDLADIHLKKIFSLMVPRTIGIGAASFETIIINAFASFLGAGSITVLNFASNLQFVPITVLGISVATAVFPQLAAHGSLNEQQEFKRKLRRALGQTIVWVGVAAVVVYYFRNPIIELLLRTGAFQGSDVALTAHLLGIFMFGVVAQSLIPIMSRAFYAAQNTLTPMFVTIATIIIHIGCAYLLTFVLDRGITGLVISYVIAGNIQFLLLYTLFRRQYF